MKYPAAFKHILLRLQEQGDLKGLSKTKLVYIIETTYELLEAAVEDELDEVL